MKAKLFSLIAALALFAVVSISADDTHRSTRFTGLKANTGTVTHSVESGKHTLMLSDDFKIPDAPAPHWQIVDSHGHSYLLQRLKIKGDKVNRTIVLPAHIHDIARVQIWCSWAEVNLGEASFEKPLQLAQK